MAVKKAKNKKNRQVVPKVLTLKITKTDIRKGVRGSTTSCPIARAAKRRFKNAMRMFVDGDLGVTFKGGKNVYYSGNKHSRKFVEKFDAEGDVHPITLTFKLPKYEALDAVDAGLLVK